MNTLNVNAENIRAFTQLLREGSTILAIDQIENFLELVRIANVTVYCQCDSDCCHVGIPVDL